MSNEKILRVVHCVDTEGPLVEDISATFERLRTSFNIIKPATIENLIGLQSQRFDLDGAEAAVAEMLKPELLRYNSSWSDIEEMLVSGLDHAFREVQLDDFGRGWICSWHCMDHVGLKDNPRRKDLGYGNIFRFYKNAIRRLGFADEINWHFHPLSLTRCALHAATSYTNSFDVLNDILCRRIIEDSWFPVVNRPGFHAERPDSHVFLEQWIPFDYANQFYEDSESQIDLGGGRFGDWRRAPPTWRGYNPDHDDYQLEGNCKRYIFRCLNVGTRFRNLEQSHVIQAFSEADKYGSAILAFADHDYRNIVPDIDYVRNTIWSVRQSYPDVKIKFCGAEEACTEHLRLDRNLVPRLQLELLGNKLHVKSVGSEIFGPQPFLAIKTHAGNYFHDNFDFDEPKISWTYVFDSQTISLDAVAQIGVGTAGRWGGFDAEILEVRKNEK